MDKQYQGMFVGMRLMVGVLFVAYHLINVTKTSATYHSCGSSVSPSLVFSSKRTGSLFLDIRECNIDKANFQPIRIKRRNLIENIIYRLRGGSSTDSEDSKQPLDISPPICSSLSTDNNFSYSFFAEKEKLMFILPDGRKRHLTITNQTSISEMLRQLTRILSQHEKTSIRDKDDRKWVVQISSKPFQWEMLQNIQNSSIFDFLSTFHQNITRNIDNSISLSIFSSADISPTNRKSRSFLNAVKSSVSNNEKIHIRRQKPSKAPPLQISKEITPILQEIYQFGGIALLGGGISSPMSPININTAERNRPRRKVPRKIITMQDLRTDTSSSVAEKRISITTALHISSNPNFVFNGNIASQLLEAKKMLEEGGLQVIGILIGNGCSLSQKSWNPLSCWSLMKVADIIQNNQTVLLSVYDTENFAEQQFQNSGNSRSHTKMRRSLTIKNNEFVLEAFQLSKQAWQLFRNNSIVPPVSPSTEMQNHRRRSKVSSSELVDGGNNHLQLLYPVRAGNQFDVDTIDIDFFAVPVPLELSSQDAQLPFLHVFPTSASLDKDVNIQKRARGFVEKLFRKIAKSSKVDDETWGRLHDVHLWQYLAIHKYLSPKAIQTLLQDLQSSGNPHVLSALVKMETDMWVNSWDMENSVDEDN